MTDNPGPWGSLPPPPTPQPKARRLALSSGLFIWLGLLAAAGVGFFAMTRLFPGRLSSADQFDALRLFGLVALVSSGLVMTRRVNFGRTARHLAIWAAVLAGLAVGFSYRTELLGVGQRLRSELIPAYAVTTAPREMVVTQSDDGHFYVIGDVDGQPVRFLVDTGSSDVVLSPDDAARLGFDPAKLVFDHSYETANGVGKGASIIAKTLAVGPIHLADVPMSVNGAAMPASLLGMAGLKRLDSFEVKGTQMALRGPG